MSWISQSDGLIYSGRPSLTFTICRSKDLEWDLFCLNEIFFKTNTTSVEIYKCTQVLFSMNRPFITYSKPSHIRSSYWIVTSSLRSDIWKHDYRSDTVNSKSVISKVLLRIKCKYKHETIVVSFAVWSSREQIWKKKIELGTQFALTMFELTVSDLYYVKYPFQRSTHLCGHFQPSHHTAVKYRFYRNQTEHNILNETSNRIE